MRKIILAIIFFIFFLLLPFIVLIRMAVYTHEHFNIHPWISIGVGVLTTAILLVVYFSGIHWRIKGKLGKAKSLKRRSLFMLSLVLIFAFNGLFYLSNANTKNKDVQKEFREIHPVLRLAVSTLIWADKDLVITDAYRIPEDYKKMGLPTKKHSLHYSQKDGYVYALDIRTLNRSGLVNFLVESYFKLMGFNTLVHGGTGTHLHVSLSCPYRPGSI